MIRLSLQSIISSTTLKDNSKTLTLINDTLLLLSSLQSLSIPFNPKIPPQYKTLPVLKKRSTLTLTLSQNKTIQITLDPYIAPLACGNIFDLSERTFYNDLPLKVNDDKIVCGSFLEGFIDPYTAKLRTIPYEVYCNGRLSYDNPIQVPPDFNYNTKNLVGVYKNNLGLVSSEFFISKGNLSDKELEELNGEVQPVGWVTGGDVDDVEGGRILKVDVDGEVERWGKGFSEFS